MNFPICLGFGETGNGAIRSADLQNPTVEPNMKCIGRPLAEIWPFEIFPNVRSSVGRSSVAGRWSVGPQYILLLTLISYTPLHYVRNVACEVGGGQGVAELRAEAEALRLGLQAVLDLQDYTHFRAFELSLTLSYWFDVFVQVLLISLTPLVPPSGLSCQQPASKTQLTSSGFWHMLVKKETT